MPGVDPSTTQEHPMAKAVLTISSKNYGAWALRGWLMARLAGLDFTEKVIPPDDPAMKAEMLLLSASMLVPSLQHNGVKVWDTLAIGEYLNEIKPKAQLLPADIQGAGALPGDLRRDAFGLQRPCAARCR
jgi:glutathione S-transferase